jgi:iron complex outermembrane receptor protein
MHRNGSGSIAGPEFSKMKQNRNYSNYFFEVNIEAVENLHVESGLALNTTKYSLKMFLENGNQAEQAYTLKDICHPGLVLPIS